MHTSENNTFFGSRTKDAPSGMGQAMSSLWHVLMAFFKKPYIWLYILFIAEIHYGGCKSIVGHGMLSRSHLLHHEHGQPHKSKSVAEIFGHKSRSNYPQILRKICREEKSIVFYNS